MSPAKKPTRPPATAERTPPAVKRPWQLPRVRTGHLFESNSLSCGKSSPLIDMCNQNPLTS